MARTTLSVQDTTLAGLTPTYTAVDAANGMQFANDGNVILHFKNGGGGAITVTLQTPGKVSGVDIVDPTVTVPATNGDKMVRTLDPSVFNQADGNVYLDFNTGIGGTAAAIRIN